jgi:hypothetical protein
MTGLEVIFITSVLLLTIFWIWFIIQGFFTSRGWGISLIFFFPISPFLFAYRFERKTRKAIGYFIGCLVFFTALTGYIHFTNVEFFANLSRKLGTAVTVTKVLFSSKPKNTKRLNLPPPTPIPPPLAVKPEDHENAEITITPATPESKTTGRYKSINMDSARNYIGKKVIITTSTVKHQGRLISVGIGEIEIKKTFEGGTTTMGISKRKITKIEVYL